MEWSPNIAEPEPEHWSRSPRSTDENCSGQQNLGDWSVLVMAHLYLTLTLIIITQVYLFIQLGQPSVNPPRLVLEVGGTSTKQAAMPGELKSPPTWNLEVGGGLQLCRQPCLRS